MGSLTEERMIALIGNNEKIILSNSNEKYVITTEDKLHLAFNDFIVGRKDVSRIFSSLSILLAFLIPILTSSFNDIAFLSADTIKGLFICISMVSFVVMCYSIILGIKNRKKRSFNCFMSKVADKFESLNCKDNFSVK